VPLLPDIQFLNPDRGKSAKRGQAVITFLHPLSMMSAEEQPARSPEPGRHQPPAGSRKFVVHRPVVVSLRPSLLRVLKA